MPQGRGFRARKATEPFRGSHPLKRRIHGLIASNRRPLPIQFIAKSLGTTREMVFNAVNTDDNFTLSAGTVFDKSVQIDFRGAKALVAREFLDKDLSYDGKRLISLAELSRKTRIPIKQLFEPCDELVAEGILSKRKGARGETLLSMSRMSFGILSSLLPPLEPTPPLEPVLGFLAKLPLPKPTELPPSPIVIIAVLALALLLLVPFLPLKLAGALTYLPYDPLTTTATLDIGANPQENVTVTATLNSQELSLPASFFAASQEGGSTLVSVDVSRHPPASKRYCPA